MAKAWCLLTTISLLLASVVLAQDPPPRISDEGGAKSVYFNLDCVGAGVACSTSGINATVTVAAGGGLTTQEGDVNVDTSTGTLDFGSCFDVSSSPAGEANISLDSSECTVNADALKANGANCSAGNYPLGVDASGAVESCTTDDDVPESGDFTNLIDGTNLTYSPAGTLNVDNPVVANLTGNASTATALAANGANCAASSFPLGVDASGAVESCSTSISGNAATVTFSDAASDTTTWVGLGRSQTGDQAVSTDAELIYNASTNLLQIGSDIFLIGSTGGISGLEISGTSGIFQTSDSNGGALDDPVLSVDMSYSGSTAFSGADYGITNVSTYDATANHSGSIVGLLNTINWNTAQTLVSAEGIRGEINTSAGSTITTVTGLSGTNGLVGSTHTTVYGGRYQNSCAGSACTITNLKGLAVGGSGALPASTTITDNKHLEITDFSSGSTITDNYGIYIPTLNVGTNKYPLYVHGTGGIFLGTGASKIFDDGTDLILDPEFSGSGVVRIGDASDSNLIGNRLNFCNTAIDSTAYIKGDCTGAARAALSFSLTKTGTNGIMGNTVTMKNQTTSTTPNVTSMLVTTTSDTTTETGGIYTGYRAAWTSLQNPAGAADMDYVGYHVLPGTMAAYTSDTVNQIGFHADDMTLPSGASAGALYSAVFEEDLAFVAGRCIEWENTADGAFTAGDTKVCHDSGDTDLEILIDNTQVMDWDNDEIATHVNTLLDSTDAGATGPVATVYHNSASPAASDVIYRELYQGEDSAGNTQDYAKIEAGIAATTSTTEDGRLDLAVVDQGTMKTMMRFEGAAAAGNGVIIGDVAGGNYTRFLSNTISGNKGGPGSFIKVGTAHYRVSADQCAFSYEADVDACLFFRGSVNPGYAFYDTAGVDMMTIDVGSQDLEIVNTSKGIDTQTAGNILTVGRVQAGQILYGAIATTTNQTFHTTDPDISAYTFDVQTSGTDPSLVWEADRATTTDATLTVMTTIAITASSSTYVECNIGAIRTGGAAGAAGDGASYKLQCSFRDNAGTLTERTETESFTSEDQAGWDVSCSVSGTNAQIEVTGAASNNITWNGWCQIHSVVN